MMLSYYFKSIKSQGAFDFTHGNFKSIDLFSLSGFWKILFIFSFLSTSFFSVGQTVLYNQDFSSPSGFTLVNGTQVNQWHEGNAAGNIGNSIYISNDVGVTNAYTITTTSVTSAYRDIAIPSGTTLSNFSFDWKANGQTNLDYLKVWLVPISFTPTAGTTITAGAGRVQVGGFFNLQATWQNYTNPTLDITAFANNTMRLVFEWVNNASSGSQAPAAVDNISLTIPTCFPPLSMVVTAIASSSATISWTPTAMPPSDGYEYYYDTSPIAPTATTIPSGTTLAGVNTDDLTGLDTDTRYYVWVRSNCGVSGKSAWASGGSFSTTQVPATIPYNQDFSSPSGFTLVNGTQVNQWHEGNAAGNPVNSIYISNDGGVTNAYTLSPATSTTHAYRDIAIPSGTTLSNFSFDWKANGQTDLDYFRVWLVPSMYTPIAGTPIPTGSGRIQVARSGGVGGFLFMQETTWQTNSNVALNISSFANTTMRLVFEWVNNSSGGSQAPAAIDNISLTILTCLAPTNLLVSEITPTSAKLNWTASNSNPAGGYDVFISTTNTPPTGATIPTANVGAGGTTYTYAGASVSTYYYWIRSNCGGTDFSDWNAGGSFTTSTSSASLPYSEDFSGAFNFNFINGSQENQWVYGSAAGNPGNSIYISNDAGTTNAYNLVFTSVTHVYKDIAIPSGTTFSKFSFDWKANGQAATDYLRVWLVPYPYAPSAGVPITAGSGRIQLGSLYHLQTGWQTYDNVALDLSSFANTTMRLVFEWVNNSTSGAQAPAAIDNISLNIPICLPPTSLVVNVLNTTSANLSWTASNSSPSDGYDVYISTSNTAPTLATVPSSSVLAGVTTYAFSGAPVNSTYYYWIRSNCGASSWSDWNPGGSFTTSKIPVSLPFLEDFSGTPSFSFINGSQVNQWVSGSLAAAGNPANSMYISNNGGAANSYNVLETAVSHAYVDINIPAGTTLSSFSFDWKANGQAVTDYLKVWLVPISYAPIAGSEITAGVGRIQVGGLFNRKTIWQTFGAGALNLSSFANSTMRLVFQWTNDATTGTQAPAAIDNVALTRCLPPSALVASALATNSATISWTENAIAPADGHAYYISTSSTTPSANTAPTGVTAAGVLSVNLTSLNADTPYYFWVRSNCGVAGSSIWIAGGIFSTTQVPATVPYLQDFGGVNDFTFINGTQVNRWITGAVTGNTGNSMFISNDGGLSNSYSITSTSIVHAYRDISIPSGTTLGSFSFDWKANGQSTVDYLRVWMIPTFSPIAGTAIAPASGRVQVGVFNLKTTWQTYSNITFDLSSFANTTMRLVFEWVNNSSVGNQNPAAIDNVSLKIPTCLPPTNLTVSGISSSGATMSWTASNSSPSNGYDVYVSTINTPPTVATVPTGSVGAGVTTFDFTGAASFTTYYYWVRANCGGSDFSDWNAGGNFSTTQPIANLPYLEDFSGTNTYTFVNGTQANKWAYGSAVGNPANSMYISNDGGVTNAYTYTSSSVTHAYKDIAIPVGASTASFSFDWKANGDASDYFRVWLVPASFTPTAGTQITTGSGRNQVGATFNLQSTWQTYSNGALNISNFANTTMRLVFEWRNDGAGSVQTPAAIDNILLTTCLPPSTLVASAFTTTSATISWTANATAPSGSHQYFVSTSATSPSASTTPTGTGVLSANLTSLTANTTYYFWVRSNCGSPGKSVWVAGGSFNTIPLPATLPYTQDFSGVNDFYFMNGSQTNKWISGSGAGNLGNSIYISNNSAANAYTTSSTSIVHAFRDFTIPNGTTQASFSFDWKANGEALKDYLRVWLVPNSFLPTAGTQITTSINRIEIAGSFNLQTTWQTFSLGALDLSSFANSTLRIVFEWTNDGASGAQTPAAIDNVSLSIPACAGTPNAGTATSNFSAGCIGSTTTLSATGVSLLSGVTFQWQSSPTNTAPWTNVSGATSVNYSFIPSSTSYYRLVSTCSGMSNQSSSVLYTVDNCYIVPATGSNSIVCGTNTILKDHAGNANYSSDVDGYTVLNATSTSAINISGSYDTESNYDFIEIYSGSGTGGTLLSTYSGAGTINYTGVLGQTLTVRFRSDSGNESTGFSLNINYTGVCFINYQAAIQSVDYGSSKWCAGETRTVTVTVKNTGVLAWTNSSPDINIGVKWNTDGSNWATYYLTKDANDLAAGATGTYTFTMQASNHIGAGFTTPLTGGSNNISVDIENSGNCWFGSNSGACGPGNTVFVSQAINIVDLPSTPSPAIASPAAICVGQTSNLNAISAGNNINWWNAVSAGTLLTTVPSGDNYAVSPTLASTTYYAESMNVVPASASVHTFNYSGSVQTFVVPAGVTSVTINALGSQGTGVSGLNPGNGGRAQGVLSVTPGQVLHVFVGGTNGFNGGGSGLLGANGGGASDVRVGGLALANRIIVAGGGGGAGGDSWQCLTGTGHGGGGTAVGSNFIGGAGGAGATVSTGCGTAGANTGGIGGIGEHGGGGGGGGFTSGGTGAASDIGTAQSGSLGLGGNSYNSSLCSAGTGGGGGGYYGGGGAAGNNCGAGRGGGGSSWTGTLTSPLFQSGIQTGNGQVIISYVSNVIPGCASTNRVAVTVNTSGSSPAAVATATGASLVAGDLLWSGNATNLWGTTSNWYAYDGSSFNVSTTAPTATSRVFVLSNSTVGICTSATNTTTVAASGVASDVFIGAGATMSIDAAQALEVKGNWTNNGTFAPNATSTVTFNGTTNQTLGGANATTFASLTVTKPTGTLTLNAPVNVTGTLTMTLGDIITSSSNLLTVGSSAASPGTLNWTNGTVLGPIKRYFSGTANASQASGIFPVGLTNKNRYAQVNYTSGLSVGGFITAEYVAGGCPVGYAGLPNTVNGELVQNYENEGYWSITPDGGNLNTATYSLKLRGKNLTTVVPAYLTRLRIIKSTSHTSWDNIGLGAHSATVGNELDFTTTNTGMTGFSFFNFGSNNSSPLPIKLLSFTASCEEQTGVSIVWKTASEQNSLEFKLERSRDLNSWQAFATIAAAGNSSQLISYSYTDVDAMSGTSYYRMVQKDLNGQEEIFGPISIHCNSDENSIVVYPNPTDNNFTLEVTSLEMQNNVRIQVTDLMGKIVEMRNVNLVAGSNQFYFSNELQSGVYLIQVLDKNTSFKTLKLEVSN